MGLPCAGPAVKGERVKAPPRFALYLLPLVGIVCCSMVAFVTVVVERHRRPPCAALMLAPAIEWDRHHAAECEGYWAADEADLSGLPKPHRHPIPFPDTHRFVQKLQLIEEHARSPQQDRYAYTTFRGLSHCRMHDQGEMAGCDGLVANAEVRDRETGVCWPAHGPEHYLTVHNVYPSRQFYEYVMCTVLPLASANS
eukprot:EG_transcript_22655